MRRFIGLAFLIAASGAFAQNYTVRTLAGGALPLGPAESAVLHGAQDLAIDAAGNLFISVRTRHVVLRRDAVTSQLTVVAGTGVAGFAGDGGQATSAQLAYPDGITFDSAGNLYIADTMNNRIRRVATNGVITTFAGTIEGYGGDGQPATAARIRRPSDVAVDQNGVVYIADTGNNRIRRVVSGTISTFAGNGTAAFSGDGAAATSASLSAPRGVATGSNGEIYIADSGNHRVRVVTGANISTFAGNGSTTFNGDNIAPTAASLSNPDKVLTGSDGIVYIADTGHHRVRRVLGSLITTVAGTGTGSSSGDNGPAAEASLSGPTGLALHSSGDLYITESISGRVRRVAGSNGIIRTVAGAGSDLAPNGDNGPATSARLNNPRGVAVGPDGSVYISDQHGYRIRRVLTGGNISTFAGTGRRGSTGDGGPALSVDLGLVEGLHVDSQGRLYIADWGVNRIRRITGGTVTSIGGNDQYGYLPEDESVPATQAALAAPTDAAVDAAGNFYIADRRNHRIRRVTPQGIITTFAGSGPGASEPGAYSGDNGPATAARLNQPQSIAIDTARNRLYFTDSANHLIRMIDLTTNIITRVAGTPGQFGYSGDNGPATSALLYVPVGIAVDAAGNLYISDSLNQVIRKVSASTGRITTIAGGGVAFGDNILATTSRFATPTDLDVDAAGNIYVTDSDNNRIRVLTPEPVTITTPSPLPNGGVGVAYSVTFAVAGGVGPYTWTLVGTPPAGLSFSAGTATLSGTPTTPVASHAFSVRVRDSQGLTDENPFTVTIVTCTPSFNPSAISVDGAGVASGTLGVTRASLCGGWTATSNQSWVAIVSGGTGTGNGTIQYSVAPNTTSAQRTAQITVAGSSVTVTQGAQPCTATVQPSPVAVSATEANFPLSVAASTSCGQWSVINLPSWLTIVSGSPGTGQGTVVLRATANTAGTARTATITVAGQPVTVTQREAACQVTFAASASTSVPAEATTRQIPFTLPEGCADPAVSVPQPDTTWLSASVSGRTLSFTAQTNPSGIGRTTKIRVGQADFTVNQAGTACNITLMPASRVITSSATTGSFTVNAPAGCSWQAGDPVSWLQINGADTGTGNGTISFTASARTESGPRTGTITVGQRTFTVVQNGTAPNMTCQAVATSPTVRREGLSELAGDVTLTCTGVPAGGALADLDLTLENTTVTSRVLDDLKTATEALAILNNAAAPQLGTSAWQAGVAAPNALRWQGIRIMPSSAGGQATLKLTNIRVNASTGGETIRANVSLRSTTRIALPTATVQIATTQPGAIANRGNIVAGPGPSQMTVPVIFREQLANAFRTRAGESGYVNGTITAGQADNGTRLRVYLNIPASVRISAPRVTEGGEFARLVTADLNGIGGSEVPGTGHEPLTPAAGGVVVATWEIKSATAGLDTLTFPLVFEGATAQELETITKSMVAGLGPVATAEVATLGSPVPRFKDTVAFVQPVDLSLVPATLRVDTASAASLSSSGKPVLIRAQQQGPATSVSADIDAVNSASVPSGPVTVKSSVAADLTFDRNRTTADKGGVVTFSDDMKEARIRYVNFDPRETKRISLGLTGNIGPGEHVDLVTTVQSDRFDPVPADNVATVPIDTPACNTSLNPLSATNVAAAGETRQLTITASCDWTAQASDDWVTVVPRAGTGSLLISYTVAPNPTSQSRTTTIVVAGRTFEITQLPSAPACQLSGSGQQVPGEGGFGGFTVTNCDPMTATTATPWIILTLSKNWVGFNAATNTTTAARTGTITVGDATYTVSQAAGAACTFSVSTGAVASPAATTALQSITVTATPNTCAWTAASRVPWTQITTTSGIGSQPVWFDVNPNPQAAGREGKIVIAGQEVTVTQPGTGMTENRRLIALLYFNLLGRIPTDSEITSWANLNLSRADLAAGMIASPEFNAKSRFTAGLYVGILNRDAEYGGWLFQRNHLGRNATSETINELHTGFTVNFLRSAEYGLKFGTPTPQEYVRLLYRYILGREATQEEVDYQVGKMQPVTDQSKAQIAANFLNGEEFIIGKGGRLLSFLYYAAILQREGSPAERKAIEDALAANKSVAEIVSPLINSEEFSNLLK